MNTNEILTAIKRVRDDLDALEKLVVGEVATPASRILGLTFCEFVIEMRRIPEAAEEMKNKSLFNTAMYSGYKLHVRNAHPELQQYDCIANTPIGVLIKIAPEELRMTRNIGWTSVDTLSSLLKRHGIVWTRHS